MNPSSIKKEVVAFSQRLVRIKSYSGYEGKIIQVIEKKMHELDFDEVVVDGMGNLLGRVGNGPKSILFDSHVDTVEVNDADQWAVPPFSGDIVDNKLYGRGSVDMKSSVATTIYAAAWAKQNNWLTGKTVYVSCTVMEEDCDGENLKYLFKEKNLRPDAVVICEPSGCRITLGHKGKVQVRITTHGISAHGANPEKGKNAVYEMAEVIQRAERLNQNLAASNREPKPTLVLSQISSVSASLNAVPSECSVYLDRRMIPGETKEQIESEMNQLIAGKSASWRLGTLVRNSYTGHHVVYEPLHLAWQMSDQHPLAQVAEKAYQHFFGKPSDRYEFWGFSTDAVTPVSLGIPTIGFGPGDHRMAHMTNEHCDVQQIVDAMGFYEELVKVY